MIMQSSKHSNDNGRFFLIVWGEFFEEGSKEVTVEFGTKAHVKVYNPVLGKQRIDEGEMKEVRLKIDTSPYIIEIM